MDIRHVSQNRFLSLHLSIVKLYLNSQDLKIKNKIKMKMTILSSHVTTKLPLILTVHVWLYDLDL